MVEQMTEATDSIPEAYEELAATLEKIPNGYAKTSDDTYLRVLQWIFSEEEADLTSKMKLRGETVEELAERLEIPIEGLKRISHTPSSLGG